MFATIKKYLPWLFGFGCSGILFVGVVAFFVIRAIYPDYTVSRLSDKVLPGGEELLSQHVDVPSSNRFDDPLSALAEKGEDTVVLQNSAGTFTHTLATASSETVPPSGFPFSASTADQLSWVAKAVSGPVSVVSGEYNAYNWNAKAGLPDVRTCGTSLACTIDVVDGPTIFTTGPGEYDAVAMTVRILDDPGYVSEGGICNILKGETLFALQEGYELVADKDIINMCAGRFANFASLAVAVDPNKGEETQEVSNLVGLPLIRIGTLPGAWHYFDDIGSALGTCADGFWCAGVYTEGDTFFVEGDGTQYAITSMRVYSKEYFPDVCDIMQIEATNFFTIPAASIRTACK